MWVLLVLVLSVTQTTGPAIGARPGVRDSRDPGDTGVPDGSGVQAGRRGHGRPAWVCRLGPLTVGTSGSVGPVCRSDPLRRRLYLAAAADAGRLWIP